VYVIGVQMCFPFESLYLDRRLHISMSVVGLILGITLLAALPMMVVGGALCDRWGRRPLLVVAICGSMTLYIGLGLAHQLWLVVVLIAVEAAFGWAQYITASNAMIADLTPFPRRAEAFSIVRVALNVGITLGPLVAAPLIARDPSFRTSFIAGGAVCGLFLLMVVTLFRETRPAGVRVVSVRDSFRGYAEVLRDRRLLAFCLVALLPLQAFGQIWVTLPVMLGDLHQVSAQRWSLTLAVYGACTALLQYPVVRLLRRVHHLSQLAMASAFLGAGVAGAAVAPWPLTLACVVLLSVGTALLIPIASTVVSELAPQRLRGRYMGAWTLVFMGGYALGPLAGGRLLDVLGGRTAFTLCAATCALGAALFQALRSSHAFASLGAASREAARRGEAPVRQAPQPDDAPVT
jgi:MFS family permease